MNLGNSEKTMIITASVLFITMIFLNVSAPRQENVGFSGEEYNFKRITGHGVGVTSIVYVSGAPSPPNLTAWIKNLGEYENGTVFLNWSAQDTGNISNFLLYETLNYSEGFDFDTANESFDNSTFNYTDYDASNVDEIYYVLHTNNTGGVEDENENTWGKFSKELTQNSLNNNITHVSTPVEIYNTSFKEVFIQNKTTAYIFKVYVKDNIDGSYDIYVYYPNYDMWWPQGGKVETGKGYLIKTTKEHNLPLTGEVKPGNKTWQLYNNALNSGINFVGWGSVVPGNMTEVINNSDIDYNITKVYHRKEDGSGYTIYVYYPSYDMWWPTDGMFEPGEVYLLKTNQAMNLTYEVNVR